MFVKLTKSEVKPFKFRRTHVDGDLILDIETEVKEMITFDVLLDTTDLVTPPGLLSLNYEFIWDSGRFLEDPGELELKTIDDDIDLGTADNIVCAISFAICSASYSNLPLNQQGTLTRFQFNVLPDLINDGVSDFDIVLSSATVDGFDVTDQFPQISQEVEIQPTSEHASTISLFTLGTLSVASILKRKLRSSKLLKKELQKVP